MSERTCTKCQQTFSLVTEHWTRNSRSREGFLTQCKTCVNAIQRERVAVGGSLEYQRQYRNDRRVWVDAAKASSGPCVDCGIAYPSVAMDWDHLDASTKRQSVASMVSQRLSYAAIMNEIAKCELVCAVCHRVRTAIRAGWATQDEVDFDPETVTGVVDEKGYYRFRIGGRDYAIFVMPV